MKLQQGDVILKKTNLSIKGGKKLDHLILAEGEASGHNHQIVSGIAQLIALQGDNKGKMILNVLSDYALLKHQEHSVKNTIKEFKVKKNISRKYIKYLKEYEQIDFDNLSFDEIVAKTRHETITPKGKWEIKIVNEYDHFREETRKAVD